MHTDVYYMKKAIEQAKKARAAGEVPIGAVLVCDGKIIARAPNKREQKQEACAHAELLCIQSACRKRKNWRLEDCTLYVTLEPCPMCAGAIVNARIPRVVFGAADIQSGACGSALTIPQAGLLNHRAEVVTGVLGEECAALLTEFFRSVRARRKRER